MEKKTIEQTEIVKIWKDNDISYAEFQFSCGGDSMDDFSIHYFDSKGNEIKVDGLDVYFEDKVFKNVTFYEASDGHYIGESGHVKIELNDDEGYDPVFIYDKNATSEYLETYTGVCYVELTEAEKTFIQNYVSNINGSSDDVGINYSKDFIMTDGVKEIEINLLDKISGEVGNFYPELEYINGDWDDWFRFSTNSHDNVVGKPIIVGDSLRLSVDRQRTEYQESEY
jgi:hypothetical protein